MYTVNSYLKQTRKRLQSYLTYLNNKTHDYLEKEK